MLALDAELGLHDADTQLQEARESLEYWERRARTLPVHALRKRREARELALRWRGRVAAAERARYGSGLTGLVTQLVVEGRLGQPARGCVRRMRRFALRSAAVVAVLMTAFALAALQALVALLHALG